MKKKGFKYYAIIWAILVVLFNAIVFIVTANTVGLSNVKASFWISYALVMASFVSQILCARIAFSGNSKKLFYNTPLIKVSFNGLIASAIIGTVLMAIQKIPSWISAVICLIVAAIEAIAVVNAKAAADTISNRDAQIKQKTSFIREMTLEAEILYKNAKTEEEKRELKKLYEAFRYSDPMSSPDLADIEEEIRQNMVLLKKDTSLEYIKQMVIFVEKRNMICKNEK